MYIIISIIVFLLGIVVLEVLLKIRDLKDKMLGII